MKITNDIYKQGKLALFLDIDNTILHSVVSTHISYPLLRLEDIFAFPIHEEGISSKVFCISKLRPGAINFLKIASRFYHIILCTLGTYEYAEKIREKLNQLVCMKLKDANYETIDPLIISREHHIFIGSNGNIYYRKSFDNFISRLSLDISRSISVILDDRLDIWDSKDVELNLLKIQPYEIFSIKTIETKETLKQEFNYNHHVDQSEQGLKIAWRALSYIHRRFFEELKDRSNALDESLPSIETYLRKVRKRVLKGVNIYPIGNIGNTLIQHAMLYGANISNEYNENVTHIVIDDKKDKNHRSNLNYPVFIVNKNWIKDSLKNMKKESEIKYMHREEKNILI